MNIKLTKEEARRLILLKQGLIGKKRFDSENGVLAFIRQAGCVQFDPIDVCGKNHELTLQSRVEGFSPLMLETLLYEKRMLVDHWDKNMSIYPAEDWPYFERRRETYRCRLQREEITSVFPDVLAAVRKRGPLCAGDLEYRQPVDWYWAAASLSKAALEALYYMGELVIHHKKGVIRYFDLAERCLPADIAKAEDPNKTTEAYLDWHIYRRMGAVGLLWNRSSDAFLGIRGLHAKDRTESFARLAEYGKILPLAVEGIREPLYLQSADLPLLEEVLQGENLSPRAELIAPLDSMLWDRKLIAALFDFEYKWEIYTPIPERKFGYYVLPLLHGDRFVARMELVRDKKEGKLLVKNLWSEKGIRPNAVLRREVSKCLDRFAAYHGLFLCISVDI
jgi:uncharacterized protein YcaQ